MDSTNSRETLENRAYEALKTAIVTGVYPPGAQIVEELAASQLAVSRSPVLQRHQAPSGGRIFGALSQQAHLRGHGGRGKNQKRPVYSRSSGGHGIPPGRPAAGRGRRGGPAASGAGAGTAAPGRATPPASIWQRCSCTAPFSSPAKIPSWNAWPPIFWIRSAYSATEAC